MRCVVTGAAGFIGSHLSEHLASLGHEVTGVDCLTPYYDRSVKESNAELLRARGVDVRGEDLLEGDPRDLLDGAEVVFHLAGQPGVRASWAAGFEDYLRLNVLATQRLLEAAKDTTVSRIVFASSSSVYGEAARYPTTEDDLPAPVSPYGVTKLAAEHLCRVYAHSWAVPTVSLRYFTVYGPRQRPDMAMHRFLRAVRDDQAIPVFGSGEQVRDFTFVSDVVAATAAAGTADVPPGSVLNVAGGSSVSVNELLDLIAATTGRKVRVERVDTQAGDVTATGGDVRRAARQLGWEPRTSLADGLAQEWAWLLEQG